MLLKRDPPINFVEIILDLRRAPYRLKLTDIALAIGVDINTLKTWFYRSATPNYDDGDALRRYHALVIESCENNQDGHVSVIQSASHARSGAHPKENAMPPRNKPKQIAAPGDEPRAPVPTEESGESNVDEAIDMAAQGKARRISKPKPDVPPSSVKGDPMRPASAPVNQKREMPYAEAMALLGTGELKRSVLTEQGWVTPPLPEPPKGAR